MALNSSDLLYVQRPSGLDAGNYKMTAGDLVDFIASSPAVNYRGTVDCTAIPSGQLDPDPAVAGDLYINTGDGNVATGWTGIETDPIVDGQRVIFDGSTWEIIGSTGGGGVETVTGTAPITVGGTTEDVIVGIDEATQSAFGSTRLAQDPPASGDLTSTAVTDVLHVAHFNELAGRITVGAAGGVQSVSADNGLTASGTTDVTVSGVDATTAVKGVVQLTDTVTTDSTKAVTGTGVEGYAVPLNINSLTALP
jgi:hypothetical protein